MFIQNRLLIVTLALSLNACSYNGSINLPGLYRIDIQQGNVIDQDMLSRLRPGMDKNQVAFILGTPAISDPFHNNQWDYIFSMAEESENRQQRHLRIHFVDDKLTYISGDITVSDRDFSDPIRQSRSVDVPLQGKKGIFQRIFNNIPFIADRKPRRRPTTVVNEETVATENEETDASEDEETDTSDE